MVTRFGLDLMDPAMGPPLPRSMGIYWPWYRRAGVVPEPPVIPRAVTPAPAPAPIIMPIFAPAPAAAPIVIAYPPRERPVAPYIPPPPVEGPTAPDLRFEEILISPSTVNVGEIVEVSVLVRNIGDAIGSEKVVLETMGFRRERGVTLRPDESKYVIFGLVPTEPGDYNVTVGGLRGSFEVVGEPPSPPPPPYDPIIPPPVIPPPPTPSEFILVVGVIPLGVGTIVRIPDQPTYKAGTGVGVRTSVKEEFAGKYGFSHLVIDGGAPYKSPTINMMMNANHTIIAHYNVIGDGLPEPPPPPPPTPELRGLTLDVLPNLEAGSVDFSPIADRISGRTWYFPSGINVGLVAVPNTTLGYKFKRWKGDISSTSQRVSVLMDIDKVADIVFEKVTVEPPPPPPPQFNIGDFVRIGIPPNISTPIYKVMQRTFIAGMWNYRIQEVWPSTGPLFWEGENNLNSSVPPTPPTPTPPPTSPIADKTLTVDVYPTDEFGKVIKSPDLPLYRNGSSVILTAVPNPDLSVPSRFIYWQDEEGDSWPGVTTVVKIVGDTYIMAMFTQKPRP